MSSMFLMPINFVEVGGDMLEKIIAFKNSCCMYIRTKQTKKNININININIDIVLKIILHTKQSNISIPVANIKNRATSINTKKQQTDCYTYKKYVNINRKLTIIDFIEVDNLEFAKHWKILENNFELSIDVLNYFSILDKYNFYSLFINFSESKVNLYKQPRYKAYRIKLLLLNKVVDKLYENNSFKKDYKLKQVQDIFFHVESKVLKTLINSINFEKKINKQQLAIDELAKINRYTKYTQVALLQDSLSIDAQYIRDLNRNFFSTIILKKNSGYYSDLTENNKNYKISIEDQIQLYRKKINQFIQDHQLKNTKTIENAILLESTQSGTAVIHLVLKKQLNSMLNLPEDNYIINFKTPQLKIEVIIESGNIVIKHCLTWINGATIEKLYGYSTKIIGLLPSITVTGNLYFNINNPENSFYDCFTISV